jgi:hypothetical protein
MAQEVFDYAQTLVERRAGRLARSLCKRAESNGLHLSPSALGGSYEPSVSVRADYRITDYRIILVCRHFMCLWLGSARAYGNGLR